MASRALTQAHIVQAKREEQVGPCHFTSVREVATWWGEEDRMLLIFPLCFMGCSSRLVFGMLYPAYASYKAVKTKNIREYVSVAVGGRASFRSGGTWQSGEGLNWHPLPPGA